MGTCSNALSPDVPEAAYAFAAAINEHPRRPGEADERHVQLPRKLNARRERGRIAYQYGNGSPVCFCHHAAGHTSRTDHETSRQVAAIQERLTHGLIHRVMAADIFRIGDNAPGAVEDDGT